MYDSHAHVISGNVRDFPPVAGADSTVVAKLATPFTAETLLAAMDRQGVGKALLVQRGQVYGYDNRYVIAAAATSGGRLKAVCGIDATDPDCGGQVRDLHAQGAAGVRLMAPMGERGFEWLDGAQADGFWRASADLGVPVCVHFFPWNRDEGMQRLGHLLDRYSIADLVIDHLANGPIASAEACGIDDLLRRLSERRNVALKFTAIPLNDLMDRGIDAGAVVGAYLELFGPDRLLWGSDVTQSRGEYGDLVASGRAAIAFLPAAVQDALLRANVARIYAL